MDHGSTGLETDGGSIGRKTHWSDRRRQNLSLPISKLPFEVLSEIFSLSISYFNPWYNRDPQTIARQISQVSHSWRVVALGCSTLWSRVIDFTCGAPEWTEELLLRARGSPIDLHKRSNRLKTEMLARELQHLGRVRIFSLDPSTKMFPTLIDNICQQAPHLEEFKLHSMGLKGKLFLPPSVFGGCSPRLRCLDMRRCSVDFDLPVFHQLQFLRVRDLAAHKAPSVAKWLDILANMPLLAETLHLSPSLVVSVAILSHLIYTDTTNLSLRITETSSADFESLFKILARQLSRLNVRCRYPSITFFVSENDLNLRNCVGYQEEEKTTISAYLLWQTMDVTWHSIIPAFTSAFGSVFQEVTSLQFVIDPSTVISGSNTHILADLLRKFGNVEQLYLLPGRDAGRDILDPSLRGNGSPSTVSLFADTNDERQQNSQTMFPSLRRIRLRKIIRGHTADQLQGFENLISFLLYRSRIGANITDIYLEDPEILESHEIRLIKELGLQVFNDIG